MSQLREVARLEQPTGPGRQQVDDVVHLDLATDRLEPQGDLTRRRVMAGAVAAGHHDDPGAGDQVDQRRGAAVEGIAVSSMGPGCAGEPADNLNEIVHTPHSACVTGHSRRVGGMSCSASGVPGESAGSTISEDDMPRIPVHTVDNAPEASRDALKQLEAKYGKVLNIHGGMAHSPAVLHSYVALQDVIREHALLDPRTREAIALAVGNQDECTYCQSAHTGGGKAAGLSDDEMIAIRRGEADFDPTLDALLHLARDYTANVGSTSDDAWQAALDAGWSVEQLTELSTHVTLNLFTNYFNHHVHTELDVPEAPPL